MCGIAGFWEFSTTRRIEDRVNRVEQMLTTLSHRGPDDRGIAVFGGSSNILHNKSAKIDYQESDFHLVLGHNRLSIIDLSYKGHQPMKTVDKKFTITFNGEIYNYKELRKDLSTQYVFNSESDTEVLLAMYSVYGTEMLNKLDGMFAFAIWDNEKRSLFCARDPMGIKPFYYLSNQLEFIFGSEPKAIQRGLGICGKYDHSRIADFLLVGISDYDDRTSFEGIKQLQPGHSMMITANQSTIRQNKYWDPPKINHYTKDWPGGYKGIAYNSIKRQLRSDVTIGSSLSGGIDSAVIVRMVSEILGSGSSQYNTLTFSFPEFKDDESVLAKQIADSTDVKWHCVTPQMDGIVSDLETMITSMGEPFTTLSMFAHYKVMEKAHQLGIKVMLDGQGGDEVYLGYPRVAQRVLAEYLLTGNILAVSRELRGFQRNGNSSALHSLATNLYFNSKSIALNKNMRILKKYVDLDFLLLYNKELMDDYYGYKDIYSKQLDELTKYCLPRLLRYGDRNSMHFSVEARVPHLSVDILEYCLSAPFPERVYNGWTKYIVRRALSDKLPEEIIWNPVKRGFGIPQEYWVGALADHLKIWINDLPNDTPFKKDRLLTEIESPNRGSKYLWRVLSVISLMILLKVKI